MFGLPTITTDQAAAAFGSATGAEPAIMLLAGLVVLGRLVGFMMVAPFFGSMNIPMTARMGLAVVLTAVITPLMLSTAVPAVAAAGQGLGLLLLLVNQVLIGVMMGFVPAFVFYAVESAGRIIDTQRGSNITDIIAPQTGERTSPVGQWLMMIALMILVLSNQHLLMLDALIDSFKVFPATASLDWIGNPLNGDTKLIEHFANMSGAMLEMTMKIAAPAMISLMLADILLGIINRGAPQVNVFALSQVIKGPIGIGALLVAIASIVAYIETDAIPGIFKGDASIHHLVDLMRAGGHM